MTAIRCTAKLLKAMKAMPVAQPSPAKNRLGEWGANLVRVSRIQLVLAVNEPTRLAVVIDAAPYATIPSRLCEGLFTALCDVGIDPETAAAEIMAMLPLDIAAGASKSVLGALNQFAWQIDCGIYTRGARSAVELTRDLMRMIVLKPRGIDFPVDRVREAFGLPEYDRRRYAPDVSGN